MGQLNVRMMTLAWAVVLCICCSHLNAQALGSIRNDVSGGGGSSSGRSSSGCHDDDDDDGILESFFGGIVEGIFEGLVNGSDDDHCHHDYDCHESYDYTVEAESGIGEMLVMGFTSPFWGPRSAMNDDGSQGGLFPSSPYDDHDGWLIRSETYDAQRVDARDWFGRFEMNYADEFDGLGRVGGHLQVQAINRWGLDIQTDWLHENLDNAPGSDHLWIGDSNVIYRFSQNERVQFYTGIGLNWIAGTDLSENGFNFTYGVDLFPVKPLIATAVIDWGKVGNAGLFRFRTSLGLAVHHAEQYVGYEYLDIGSTQTNMFTTGVRFWF